MKIVPTVPCTAERVGTSTRFRFTCRAGHVTTEDINKGKPKHLHLHGTAVDLMASWWSRSNAPVAFHCPLCFPKGKTK